MTDLLAFQPTPTDPPSPPWTSCAPAAQLSGPPLIVSTHQALLSVDGATGCVTRLNSGRGHYYGVATASSLGLEAGLLLVGSQYRMAQPVRNASWLPAADALLLVDPAARRVRGHWRLPTQYLHDSATHDGAIHAVDTATGYVSALRTVGGAAATPDLRVVRRYAASTARPMMSHINNVGFGGGAVWVLENNNRQRSSVVALDAASGAPRGKFALGGPNCHQLNWFRGALVHLLSSVGGIVVLRPPAAPGGAPAAEELWSAGPLYFSKGLAIVDGVAYFGVARKQAAPPTEGEASARRRAARFDRNAAAAELVAYDLDARALRWRRALPFSGLVNAVSAPEVAAYCSWRACSRTGTNATDALAHGPKAELWLGTSPSQVEL